MKTEDSWLSAARHHYSSAEFPMRTTIVTLGLFILSGFRLGGPGELPRSPTVFAPDWPAAPSWVAEPEPVSPALPEVYALPVWAVVTAYSPEDPIDQEYRLTKGKYLHKTSVGVDIRVRPHGIACDPTALPYGTTVAVPGYLPESKPMHAWPVDDTGGGLRQTYRNQQLIHVDVRYRTHYSSRRWGKRYMQVHVQVQRGSALEAKLLAYNRRAQERPEFQGQ